MHSGDFGETWTALQTYVVQYDWVRNMKSHAAEYAQDAVFVTMHAERHREGAHQVFGKWDNRVDFVVSHDLMLTHTVLVERGNRFLFTERYLAVVQVAEEGATVTLQVSPDGGHRWHAAELEYPMTQHSYTITHITITANDAVFLAWSARAAGCTTRRARRTWTGRPASPSTRWATATRNGRMQSRGRRARSRMCPTCGSLWS